MTQPKRTRSQAMSVRMSLQQEVACPHCNKKGKEIAMKRWHFDNCKHKSHKLF